MKRAKGHSDRGSNLYAKVWGPVAMSNLAWAENGKSVVWKEKGHSCESRGWMGELRSDQEGPYVPWQGVWAVLQGH